MVRRKRRRRGLWLPTTAQGVLQTFNFQSNGAPLGITTALFDNDLDAPTNPARLLAEGLTDLAGFLPLTERPGLFVHRVVGSIFVSANCLTPDNTNTVVHSIYVKAALRVCDVNPSTGLLTDFVELFADEENQSRSIWRRQWVLTAPPDPLGPAKIDTPSTRLFNGPNTNIEYGSVREGTHVDTKGSGTKVGYGQRLVLIVEAATLVDDTSVSESELPQCSFMSDLRIYATPMMRARRG